MCAGSYWGHLVRGDYGPVSAVSQGALQPGAMIDHAPHRLRLLHRMPSKQDRQESEVLSEAWKIFAFLQEAQGQAPGPIGKGPIGLAFSSNQG